MRRWIGEAFFCIGLSAACQDGTEWLGSEAEIEPLSEAESGAQDEWLDSDAGCEPGSDGDAKGDAIPPTCDGVADGTVERRSCYAAPIVSFGDSCISQTQTRTCDRGNWNPDFPSCAYLSCEVKKAGMLHYIDNQSGSNCDDLGTGTSLSQPWCTFGPASSHGPFEPGDWILLARGAIWNEELNLTGSGTTENPILLGAYGDGPRPRIIRNGNPEDRGIRLTDPFFWEVSDLELGYSGVGLLVLLTGPNREGLTLRRLYVHHHAGIFFYRYAPIECNFPLPGEPDTADASNAAGIAITGIVPDGGLPEGEPALRKVWVEDIEGEHNLNTFSIGGNFGGVIDHGVQDVVITGMNTRDDDGGPYCMESLRFVNARNLIMMNSVVENGAGCWSCTGTVSVFLGQLQDALFVNNIIWKTANTHSNDMGGVDYESATRRVNFSNNFIAHNAGPGIELLNIWNNWSEDNEFTGNVFVSNSTVNFVDSGGSFWQYGHTTPVNPSGLIRDNIYYEPTREFLSTMNGGTFEGFEIKNNWPVQTTDDLFVASVGFSDTQGSGGWSYRYRTDGGLWTALPWYDPESQAWTVPNGGPTVYRFEQEPGSCADCQVARVWVAPDTRQISIRSRVLLSKAKPGEGVVARITKNNIRIWPLGGDQTVLPSDVVGFEANLDNVSVVAGDEIRFEVGGLGTGQIDRVSWAPTIASLDTNKYWRFLKAGDTEGMGLPHNTTLSVSGGRLVATVDGADPYFHSADELGISAASYRYLHLRVRSDATEGTFQVRFITDSNTAWDNIKVATFDIPTSAADFTTQVIDLATVPGWSGTIRQLRFDPTSASTGTVVIDDLALSPTSDRAHLSAAAFRWQFDTANNLEGMTANSNLTLSVGGGVLLATFSGADPYFYSPDHLSLPSASYRWLKLRFRNNTTGPYFQIFFITDSDTVWNETKSMAISMTANEIDFNEHVVDMNTNASWLGTIRQIRFDPTQASSGSVEIDSIAVTSDVTQP